MGTFVVDTSKDTLLKVCDCNLVGVKDCHKSEKYNHYTKKEKEIDLKEIYSHWLIKGTILLTAQETKQRTG